MHQDFSPDFVGNQSLLSEVKAGDAIVRHLLAGDRGHYGPFEHPQITLACGYFPHSVTQQVRTHRTGITFDVQSFRWTGSQVVDVALGKRSIEDVFYLRPVGRYRNRDGSSFDYTSSERDRDLLFLREAVRVYQERFEAGMSEEQCRDILPAGYRQHFVMSCNARTLMHLLDMRAPANAQIECQWFCELLLEQFECWMPDVAAWYVAHRYKKSKLAP
jgi:thymidylate synthase (FAD)